eukprot:2601709-Rhodomonas_salina.6
MKRAEASQQPYQSTRDPADCDWHSPDSPPRCLRPSGARGAQWRPRRAGDAPAARPTRASPRSSRLAAAGTGTTRPPRPPRPPHASTTGFLPTPLTQFLPAAPSRSCSPSYRSSDRVGLYRARPSRTWVRPGVKPIGLYRANAYNNTREVTRCATCRRLSSRWKPPALGQSRTSNSKHEGVQLS